MHERLETPMDLSERPTFLPGDKVRDRRDVTGKLWRVVGRNAHFETDYITLRRVGDDSDERTLKAKDITPYLEMVAPYALADGSSSIEGFVNAR